METETQNISNRIHLVHTERQRYTPGSQSAAAGRSQPPGLALCFAITAAAAAAAAGAAVDGVSPAAAAAAAGIWCLAFAYTMNSSRGISGGLTSRR